MKTKKAGVPKAHEHYRQEEINLILSQLPTHTSMANLSKSLGRTEEAIKMIFVRAYDGKFLRESIRDLSPRARQNLILQIVKAREELGIFVGHRPSKITLELASKM